MSKAVIKVSNLSKSYDISHQNKAGYYTVKDTFTNILKKPIGKSIKNEHETFWALDDVSFEVNKGEIFGVIGKNGSGKSTLLKTLSRIIDPTKGKIEMHGRVASLLEVGTGFHPELTGRENVYFNGSMIGMSRQEIRKRFNEIVEFSEIEKFIDTPVKFYSSGMYVRLAFAVAAHLEPDVLILDEVLAVGDAGFQKKSLKKIISTMESGCTVLIVSHSAENLKKLCKRGLLLNGGRVQSIGNIDKVLIDYSGSLPTQEDPRSTRLKEVEVGFLHIKTPDILNPDSPLEAEVDFKITEKLHNCRAHFFIEDSSGRIMFHSKQELDLKKFDAGERTHKLLVSIPRISLGVGNYSTWVRFVSTKEYGDYAADTERHVFEVTGPVDEIFSPIELPVTWS